MALQVKSKERKDLENVVSRLAKVKLLARAIENHVALSALATFGTATFESGEYNVSVGITQAILRIDHPSYDRSEEYSAVLAKEFWTEKSKISEKSSKNISGEVGVAAKFFNAFKFTGKASAEKDNQKNTENSANLSFPLVTQDPVGWRIGSELGDPRDPAGTLPQGLEHCLSGGYFDGKNGEIGSGYEYEKGKFALCRLTRQQGGNDPAITATLTGLSGALRINFRRKIPRLENVAKDLVQIAERQDAMRRVFIGICVERAAKSEQEDLLTGEFQIASHKIHAPKLIEPVVLEPVGKKKVEA